VKNPGQFEAKINNLPLTNRICPPDWTQQEGRFLKRPFFPAQLFEETGAPTPFAR
jgi:hypothetical protein